MASPIDQYLLTLERTLSFDQALAQRVCAEVEDHLRERSASYSNASAHDAETRAIKCFGTAHQLAAQFALASIRKTTERLSIHMLALVGMVFAIMQWRVAAIAGIIQTPQLPHAATLALVIHQLSFWFASLTCVLGFAACRLPISDVFEQASRLRLCAALLFSTLTALSALGSVVMESYLTATKLSQADLSESIILPAGLMIVEIAFVIALTLLLKNFARRAIPIWKLISA